eukprot:gene9208-12418_t
MNLCGVKYTLISHPLRSSTKDSLDKDNRISTNRVYILRSRENDSTSPNIELTLRNFIATKQFDEAKKIISSLNSTILPSSGGRNVVYVITETCRITGSVNAILPFLKSFNNNSNKKINSNNLIECDENDVMPLLNEYATIGNMRPIQPIITYLIQNGMKTTAKTYATLLKGYGRQRNDLMIDNILLAAYENKITPDIIMLNAAMDAYIRCDNSKRAFDMFNFINSKSDSLAVVPNIDTNKKYIIRFNSTVSKKNNNVLSTTQNSIEKISAVFSKTVLIPNTRTYNILMKGIQLSNTFNFENCIEIMSSMKRYSIQPDSVTVNTLIDACVRSENIKKAEELLSSEVYSLGTVEAYTSVISGYANKGDIRGAFRVLQMMTNANIQPTSYTLTAIMNACIMSRNFNRAKELLRSNNNYNSQLSSNELTALHGAYVIGLCQVFNQLKSKQINQIADEYLYLAQLALYDMDKNGIQPDIATMNSFIRSVIIYYSDNNIDYNNINNNNNSNKIIKSDYSNSLISSMIIFDAMMNSHIIPDQYTFSILFTILGNEGKKNEALSLFRLFSYNNNNTNINTNNNNNVVFDTVAINSLIRAFVNGNMPIQSLPLFYELVNKNTSLGLVEQFIPNQPTYTMLFFAIAKALNEFINSTSPFYIRESIRTTIISDQNNITVSKVFQSNEIMDEDSPTIPEGKFTIEIMNRFSAINSSTNSKLFKAYRHINIIPSNYYKMSTGQTNNYDNNNNYNYNNYNSNNNDDSEKNNRLISYYITNLNSLLISLFKQMRFEYGIIPDDLLVSAICAIYTAVDRAKQVSFFELKQRYPVLSKESSRLVFEDLVLCGIHPSKMTQIMKICDFTSKESKEYLENDQFLIRFRTAAASYRIFKKYGWNSVDSGWSPLF